jgi:RHS repeat-associated protein
MQLRPKYKSKQIAIPHQYPFGSMIQNRNWSAVSGYRYGFNGQEGDAEVSGEGNSYTAEYWQYDSRLGRRWNVDPVVKHNQSGYSAYANNPILIIDPNGADSTVYLYSAIDRNGNAKYDIKSLEKIANEAQNIANLNGLSVVKFRAITLSDLENNTDIKLNPYSDLIYRADDDKLMGITNPGKTARNLVSAYGENEFRGMKFIQGEIYPNEISEIGGNFNINGGITLAHEAFTHGYRNIVSHLFGVAPSEGHRKRGLESEYGNVFYKNSYTRLRESEEIHSITKNYVYSLFKFSSGVFASTHKKDINAYKYGGNQLVDRVFTGVLKYYFIDLLKI